MNVSMNIVVFLKQVRQELSKVTWSSRKETVVSTGMVLIMVAIASLFFFVVDMAAFKGVQFLLGFGS
jgi:preprotein translocase subunit SecE